MRGRRQHVNLLPGYIRALWIAVLSLMLSACLGIPENAEAVDDFELERYLGKWYEIARLDHRFERGLSRVTAEYSLRDDGGVRVVNSGYNAADGEWSVAEGKAYLIGEPTVGRLKVSFFGPFYGAYNIIDLDRESYRYAMIIGPNADYLWILSREPHLETDTLNRLMGKAERLGIPVSQIIFPEHGDKHNMAKSTTLDMDPSVWYAVHDRVMGGVSDGTIISTDDGLRFEGALSLENNGGFASVRRPVRDNLEGADRVRLRVRGDGRRYQVRLRLNNTRDGVAWREHFDTDGSWQDVVIMLEDLVPVFRGRRLSGFEPVDASQIQQLGLMLADGNPGRFELEISHIEFQSGPETSASL